MMLDLLDKEWLIWSCQAAAEEEDHKKKIMNVVKDGMQKVGGIEVDC